LSSGLTTRSSEVVGQQLAFTVCFRFLLTWGGHHHA
jgi:hypothetical protein